MEAGRGAHVHVEIGVVDIMEAPEEGDHVIGPVPPPVGIIHEKKTRDCAPPIRQVDPVQHTNVSILCPPGDGERYGQHRPSKDRMRWNGEQEIADKPPKQSKMLASQRETPLQPEQRNEYSGEQRIAGIIEKRDRLHIAI